MATLGIWRPVRTAEFNEEQPRAEDGKWEATGKTEEDGGGKPETGGAGSMQSELGELSEATSYGDISFEENGDLAEESDLESWGDLTQEYADSAGLEGDAFSGYEITEGSPWANVGAGGALQEQADVWMVGFGAMGESPEFRDAVANGYVHDGDLYRGMTMDTETLGSLKEGDTIDGQMSSWSSQEGVAAIFAENAAAEHEDRTPVVMQMEGGGNALPVGLVASPDTAVSYAWQNEYVSSASLTVTGVEERAGGSYITVRQA